MNTPTRRGFLGILGALVAAVGLGRLVKAEPKHTFSRDAVNLDDCVIVDDPAWIGQQTKFRTIDYGSTQSVVIYWEMRDGVYHIVPPPVV